MKTGRHVYNTLNKFVKKVIHTMRLVREAELIVVAFLIGMFYEVLRANVVDHSQSFWSWTNILANIEKVVGLVVIIYVICWILKRINKRDKTEDEKDIEDKAKLDAIIKKLGITLEEINKEKPNKPKKEKKNKRV